MTDKERAEKLRALKGCISIQELADATGLNHNTIRNALSQEGSNMTIDTLQRLAKALKVHPAALV